MRKSYFFKFGEDKIEIFLPEKNVLTQVEVPNNNSIDNQYSLIEAAIQNPQDTPPLEEFVKNKKIIILAEDATRDVPTQIILNIISKKLSSAKSVKLIICTGTHNPNAEGNQLLANQISKIFENKNLKSFELLPHDSKNPPFDSYGISSFGNEFLVNPALKEADAYLVLSDMKNHYFAGYSNLLKNFIPGVCAFETVEKNHAMALNEKSTFGRHPWHPDPDRRDNPLANEMLEGYQKVVQNKPVWALVSITKNRRVIWCRAGSPQKMVEDGIRKVDADMSKTVVPADVLIISCGGYPNDESIYTAQRALELNQHAVKKGGKIIFLAECRNGIGPESAKHNFYDLLTNELPEVLKTIEKKYIMYSHKAYKFAKMMTSFAFIGIKSAIDDDNIKNIHLVPTQDPQSLIDSWLNINSDLTFNLIDDGNKIAIYPGNSSEI
jgi:nickel-dependent lactate racemase